jgi:hypothetical protein
VNVFVTIRQNGSLLVKYVIVRNGQLLMVYVLTMVQNEQSVELKTVTTIERIVVCVGDMVQKNIFVEQKTVIKLV